MGRSWGNGVAAPRGSVESDVVMSQISLATKLPSSALIVVTSTCACLLLRWSRRRIEGTVLYKHFVHVSVTCGASLRSQGWCQRFVF